MSELQRIGDDFGWIDQVLNEAICQSACTMTMRQSKTALALDIRLDTAGRNALISNEEMRIMRELKKKVEKADER